MISISRMKISHLLPRRMIPKYTHRKLNITNTTKIIKPIINKRHEKTCNHVYSTVENRFHTSSSTSSSTSSTTTTRRIDNCNVNHANANAKQSQSQSKTNAAIGSSNDVHLDARNISLSSSDHNSSTLNSIPLDQYLMHFDNHQLCMLEFWRSAFKRIRKTNHMKQQTQTQIQQQQQQQQQQEDYFNSINNSTEVNDVNNKDKFDSTNDSKNSLQINTAVKNQLHKDFNATALKYSTISIVLSIAINSLC
jgi:uncharacterized protein YjgD (DUF1641 family)